MKHVAVNAAQVVAVYPELAGLTCVKSEGLVCPGLNVEPVWSVIVYYEPMCLCVFVENIDHNGIAAVHSHQGSDSVLCSAIVEAREICNDSKHSQRACRVVAGRTWNTVLEGDYPCSN